MPVVLEETQGRWARQVVVPVEALLLWSLTVLADLLPVVLVAVEVVETYLLPKRPGTTIQRMALRQPVEMVLLPQADMTVAVAVAAVAALMAVSAEG